MNMITNAILENIIPYAPGYSYLDTMSDRIYRDENEIVENLTETTVDITEKDIKVLNLEFEEGMKQEEMELEYSNTVVNLEDRYNLIEMYKLSSELINDIIPKEFNKFKDLPGDHFIKKTAFIKELKDYFMMSLDQEMLLYKTLDMRI